MPVRLHDTLAWSTATADDATMLRHLQPNILKGHVRDHLAVIFLRFDDADAGRRLLGAVRPLMKSARDHLAEVASFKADRTPGSTYVGVGLTRAGYDLLGITTPPNDRAFAQTGGMKGSRGKLGDPADAAWDLTYRADLHAVVLVGDAEANRYDWQQRVDAVRALTGAGVTVVGEEEGLGQANGHGDGIEHFGYVDGRSQPLFLVEDVAQERHAMDGTSVWDPAFPLQQVIVPDPAAPDPGVHFGSYFVFRKLEQNVRAFKQGEEELADRLGLSGPDRERAGAMIVGRFEDGTPITLQADDGAHEPVMNNFDYGSDEEGSKCPFHSHIRTTNPRGSGGSPGGGPTDVEFERSHLMARRGQTYGVRTDDVEADVEPDARPEHGVGLLFMAFNADLGNQFEFTQAAWANNVDFPFSALTRPGADPVIGQGPRPRTEFPKAWGDIARRETETIAQTVTMKGGQYFFMPSLAFLDQFADPGPFPPAT